MKNEALDGIYFAKIPLELRAEPLPGFRFAGWEGTVTSAADSLQIQLAGPATIRAVFEDDDGLISTEAPELGYTFVLDQNYPNPLSQSTTIPYELPEPARVTIDVYNALGRKVMQVLDAFRGAGIHQQALEAGHLAAGTYFYELRAGSHVGRKMFIIVK